MLLFLCAGVVCCIAWWILEWGSKRRRRIRELAAAIPGPRGWPVLGNALLFMTKPEELLNTMMEAVNHYGEYCRIWLGPELLVVVKNPTDIRLLLMSNKVNQKGPMYKYMKVFTGPGILSEGGPLWRSHRKIAAPAFNRKAVQSYSEVFNETAEELAEALSKRNPNATFNIYHDVVKCTTASVCQTVFGLRKEELWTVKSMDVLVRETHALYDFVYTNMTRWWLHIPLVYRLLGRKSVEKYYLKILDEVSSDILGKRKAALKMATPETISMIDRLILSGEMSEQDMKWEIITFFSASQEASAKIASMVLLILAHLPEWQDKVFKEIVEILGPEDGVVSEDQFKELKALDMVYKEALRNMPIGAFLERTVEEEITINNGKITLPKGVTVVIPIYAVQRDPRYWEDPYTVDPGRFLPENASKRDPNAFMPFSVGAMDCIGRVLAEFMIKILVVRLLRRVQLEADGIIEDLALKVAISVSMAKGYNLRVKPREV